MQTRKSRFDASFLIAALLASLFVATEIILNSFGKSLCFSEGCALTVQSVRYGDISIFLAGLGAFLLLGVLVLINRTRRNPGLDRFINLVLVLALASEGFLMGYLAFRLHAICLFCIMICSFMVLLGLIRLLSGERDLIAGFAAFAAMFLIQYVILPAGVPVDLPAGERLILFYSKDCKHCTEIIKEFDERNIHALHKPVSGYAGFLKNMGIEHVPTLLVNDPYQKVFLTGKDAILRYLVSCSPAKQPERQQNGKKQVRQHTVPAASGLSVDIFQQPSLLTTPSPSASEAGMCKEEEACK
ncbi:MAG TPA: hypothetical protein VK654_16475 [Nitrospirota bacterium]|nr:hypothetical protein [Nitrospirota bacterium]